MITVHLPSDLAAKFQTSSDIALSAATLGEMVAALDGLHAGLGHWLVEVDGRVRPHLALFVAGERMERAAAATALPDGADIWVIRAVSGG